MTIATAQPEPPQLPRLRRLPVPVSQPRPALRVVRDEDEAVPAAQQTLALVLPMPTGTPGGARLGAPGSDPDDFAARRPTPGHVLPAPGPWAAQFVQAALEVTTGRRPHSQLTRWTTDEVRARLALRADLARRRRDTRPVRRIVVRSTRVCVPRDGVAEASAVVTDGQRTRAVALRLEGLDGRWRVTALELG